MIRSILTKFIGLYPIPDTRADTVVSVLKVSFEVFQLLRKLDNRETEKAYKGLTFKEFVLGFQGRSPTFIKTLIGGL